MRLPDVYLLDVYREIVRWLYALGVLVFLGVALFLFAVGILNGLSFTFLGYIAAKMLFDDKLLIAAAYVIFSSFTFAVLWIMDHA